MICIALQDAALRMRSFHSPPRRTWFLVAELMNSISKQKILTALAYGFAVCAVVGSAIMYILHRPAA